MTNGINALARNPVAAPTQLTPTPIDPGLAQNALVAGRRAQQQSRLTNLRISEAERQQTEETLDDLTASVLGATDEASFNAARDAFARRRGIPVERLQSITFAQLPALRQEAEGARNILTATRTAQARTTQPLTPAQERQFAIQEERNRIAAAQAGVPAAGAPGAAPGVVQATTGAPAQPTESPRARRIREETRAREQGKMEARRPQQFRKARAAVTQIESSDRALREAIGDARRIIQNATIPATGFGSVLSDVPLSSALQLERALDTIRANVGFDTLQAMREASPTGGALGSVSERENTLLQSVLGSLDPAQGEDALLRNLDRIEEIKAESAQARRAALRDDFPGLAVPTRQQPARTQQTQQSAPTRQPSGQAAAAPPQAAAPRASQPRTGQRFQTAEDAAANIAEGQIVEDTESGRFFQKQGGRLVEVQNPALGEFQMQGQPGRARPLSTDPADLERQFVR